MKPQSEVELVDLIIKWVRKNAQTNGNGHVELTGHTNLMEKGVLDSIGFVELFVFMETCTGCSIDLTDVDPSEFTTVNGLCQIALRNVEYGNTYGSNH
ncbi:MAG: acyl carrier protein [Verrucomicrobia bacterium]|nr:acyl carrier protein [Verrucomicrobiota bacterium]